MSRHVLVIGGAGFIGSHTVDALLDRGHKVRVLDALVPAVHPEGILPDYLPADAEFIHGDLRDRKVLRRALQGVDVVIHLAAVQDHHRPTLEYFDVNVAGTSGLYEEMRQTCEPGTRVVIGSTQFVQGEGWHRDSKGEIYTPETRSVDRLRRGEWEHQGPDDSPLEPVPTPATHNSPGNGYSISKEAQERVARASGRRFDFPTTIFRYSIVLGARQSIHNIYSGACRIFSLCYRQGIAPVIFEDGGQRRDFVSVHDVVAAHVMAVEEEERTDGRTFGVGGARAISILELDRIVASTFGRSSLEPNLPGLFRVGDTRHAISEIDPMHSRGWSPRRTVEESVAEYAEWIESRVPGNSVLLADGAIVSMMKSGIVGRVTGG